MNVIRKAVSDPGGMFLALFLIAALALFIGRGAASGSPHREKELIGTWTVTVQVNNCSGTLMGPPFQSLLTFEDGETMIEDTTNPSFAPGQRGTGHGVWEHQGPGTYSAKFAAFINFTTTAPPPPGFLAGTQTISQTIEFNNGPDEWTTSDATVEFFDTAGTLYRSACATASAKRLE